MEHFTRNSDPALRVPIRTAGKILFALACIFLFVAASNSGGPDEVHNVHFSMNEGRVLVYYDLSARANATYRVLLILKRESDSSYHYTPRTVTGDVGVGTFGGTNRRILWSMQDEFPQGLQGSDYYFEVLATRIKESNGPGLFTMIGAGVAVLAATATYFLVTGPHANKPQNAGLPPPPGRPQ